MKELPSASLSNPKADEAYNQYMDYWKAQDALPSATFEVIAESLRKQIEFQEFSRYEKSVKIYFDQSNFRVLFVTENVKDFSGYTREEMMKRNITLLFHCLTFDHLSFPLKTTQFAFRVYNKLSEDAYLKNLMITVCGLKLKKKDGSQYRVLMKYRPMEFGTKGMIQTALITFEDITYLVKGDFYWGHITCGENNEYKFHFISDKKTEISQDIISEREKDVLRLIAKGMESKEIGNQLFITSGTVDNHRRNMIARTGARDTTALLQLCISCGII